MWRDELSKVLTETFSSRKKKNPRYSIRAFAKSLGIAPSSLSEIINGNKNWKISKERVIQFIDKLDISEQKKRRLLIFMDVPVHSTRKPLDSSKFKFLTHWIYSAVLYAHRLPLPLRTPKKISEYLGLPLKDVEATITELCEMDLLGKAADGKTLECTPTNWSVENTPVGLIRNYHKSNLQLAIQSVDLIPAKERDISSMTFCGSPEKIQAAREEIRRCHERIMHIMDQGEDNTEILQLSIALFPMRSLKK